jgi:hypothetical protein
VDLLRARSQQRPGALVDRGSGRVDVVDEHAARAAHERHDRQAPPASELHGQLRWRVGPALQPPVAHRRHDRDRLDARTRQLVGDERPGQPRR